MILPWGINHSSGNTHLGHALFTEKEQVPVHMVLYKGKSKHRHKHNLNKKISASGKSKRYSKAAKEPWILVTSLFQAQDIANIYRQRMRIEENFRDTKCPHYGLGLKDSLARTPKRMAILLLLLLLHGLRGLLLFIRTMQLIFRPILQNLKPLYQSFIWGGK